MNYIYCRISTDQQSECSLELQEEACRKYITSDDVIVVRDIGSGKSTEQRPNFLTMLSNLKEGDNIYVYDQSRLSRNAEQSLYFLQEIHNRGAKLFCDGKSYEQENPIDKMLYTVSAGFNEFQRAIQNQKSREGLKKQYENGDAIFNGSLMGWKIIKRGKFVKSEFYEDEAKIIRYIFERYNKGDSPYKLEKELYGTPLERYFSFTADRIRRILLNPLYMGYYAKGKSRNTTRYNRQQLEPLLVKSNIYQPIVTEDVWWNAFDRYRTLSTVGSRDWNTRFTTHILSGVLCCPDCKKPVSHFGEKKTKSGVLHSAYEFHAHKADCPSHNRTRYNDTWLENVMKMCFYVTFLSGNEIGVFFNDRKDTLLTETKEFEDEIKRTDISIAEIKSKMERIVEAIADGIIDTDTAKSKMDALKKQISSYEEHKKEVQSVLYLKQAEADEILLTSVGEILDEFPKRELYLKYIKSGYNYNTYLEVEFLNGKQFKIYRPPQNRYYIPETKVEVSLNGNKQYTFTVRPGKAYSMSIDLKFSGDMWKDAEYRYLKEIEGKVNNSLIIE